MTNRLPHIIVRAKGAADVHFALAPITAPLIEGLAQQLRSAQALAKLAEVAFWDGHPVFFELPDRDLAVDPYVVVVGRPDIHWRHFKRVDRIRRVMYPHNGHWMVRWRAWCTSTECQTAGVPVTVLAATGNRYIKPGTHPTARLPDGTPLYPAYYPLGPGERCRRAMSLWDGATGEWVGVTLDGRLYRQTQYWGSDSPRPDRWREFKLVHA